MSLLQQIDRVSVAIKPPRRCVPSISSTLLDTSPSPSLPSHSLSPNLSVASKPRSEPPSRSAVSNFIESEGIRSTIKSEVVVDPKSRHLLPSAPLHQGNKNKIPTHLHPPPTSHAPQRSVVSRCKPSLSAPLCANLPPRRNEIPFRSSFANVTILFPLSLFLPNSPKSKIPISITHPCRISISL